MNHTSAASIAEFLLKLYSSAREKSVAAFPEFAIDELKRFVDFDMALFGLIRPAPGISAAVDCSWAHIHREPTNMIEEWLSLCSGDSVLQNMMTDLGRVRSYHVPTVFSKSEDAKLLDFALRTRHINLAAVANSYGPEGLCGAFSIRRADTTWKFSIEENALVQLLAPHIWEAIRINRTIMAGKVQGLGLEPVRGLCVADDKGTIVFQDNSLERLRKIMFRESNTYLDFKAVTLKRWNRLAGSSAQAARRSVKLSKELHLSVPDYPSPQELALRRGPFHWCGPYAPNSVAAVGSCTFLRALCLGSSQICN